MNAQDTVQPPFVPVKLLLTVDEAAAALSIKRSMFYLLLSHHKIASVKVGAARRIPVSALQTFVATLLEEVG